MKIQKRLSLLFCLLPVLLVPFGFTDITWQTLADYTQIKANGMYAMHPVHTEIPMRYTNWLTALFFGSIYDMLGKAGVILLCALCLVLIGLLFIHMCRAFACAPTMLSLISGICLLYFGLLPGISTMLPFWLLLLCSVYATDCLVCAKSKKSACFALLCLPLLSFMLLGLNALYWPLFIIVVLCGFIDITLPYLLGKAKNTKQVLCIFIALFAGFAPSVVRPYGSGILQSIASFWRTENAEIVMVTPDIKVLEGKVFYSFLLLVVICLYLCRKSGTLRVFHALLPIAACYTALLDQNLFPFFVLCAGICLCHWTKNIRFSLSKKLPMPLCLVLTLCLCALVSVHLYQSIKDDTIEKEMEPITQYFSSYTDEEKKNMPIFCHKNISGYISYLGFPVYMDQHTYRYLEDPPGIYDAYADVMGGRIHLYDFLSSYDFAYLYLKKNSVADTYVNTHNRYPTSYVYLPVLKTETGTLYQQIKRKK